MRLPAQILIIASIIVWVLIVRGCYTQNRDIKSLQDSLSKFNGVTDSLVKRAAFFSYYNDSVVAKSLKDSAVYVQKIDSQTSVISVLKGRFNVTKDSIGVLYGQLKTFYLNHDTVALMATYNNLHQQLIDANNMLFAIQLARDSADNTRDSEIGRLNGVIVEINRSLRDFKQAFAAEVKNSQGLSSELDKVIRQKKKANLWGIVQKIGIGIGGIFIGKTL